MDVENARGHRAQIDYLCVSDFFRGFAAVEDRWPVKNDHWPVSARLTATQPLGDLRRTVPPNTGWQVQSDEDLDNFQCAAMRNCLANFQGALPGCSLKGVEEGLRQAAEESNHTTLSSRRRANTCLPDEIRAARRAWRSEPPCATNFTQEGLRKRSCSSRLVSAEGSEESLEMPTSND